jgi:hypothetical protein
LSQPLLMPSLRLKQPYLLIIFALHWKRKASNGTSDCVAAPGRSGLQFGGRLKTLQRFGAFRILNFQRFIASILGNFCCHVLHRVTVCVKWRASLGAWPPSRISSLGRPSPTSSKLMPLSADGVFFLRAQLSEDFQPCWRLD